MIWRLIFEDEIMFTKSNVQNVQGFARNAGEITYKACLHTMYISIAYNGI